jgi:hypothetical protein
MQCGEIALHALLVVRVVGDHERIVAVTRRDLVWRERDEQRVRQRGGDNASRHLIVVGSHTRMQGHVITLRGCSCAARIGTYRRRR